MAHNSIIICFNDSNSDRQAISSKDLSIAQKITLPLAEKMCKKFLDENKIEAEAEVELYLLILEKQNKYNEMLTLMESPIGSKLTNHLDFLSKKRADLLRLIGKYEEAFEAYKQLIDNSIDQIDYYLELFDISVILDKKLETESSSDQKTGTFHYISQVISFVGNCIEKVGNRSVKNANTSCQRSRGPYLAKMVLFERLTQRLETEPQVEPLLKSMANSITDLLFEYFVEFGSKQAAIYDMFYILDKTNLTENDIQIVSQS